MIKNLFSQARFLIKSQNNILQKSLKPQQISYIPNYLFCNQNSNLSEEGKQEILDKLKAIQVRETNLVQSGELVKTEIDQSGNVNIELKLTPDYLKLKKLVQNSLKEISWISNLKIKMAVEQKENRSLNSNQQQKKGGLAHVKRIIAVSSCKGGVGKSTVAVNLAFALQKQGKQVGILDADIYGPSLPTMLNREQEVLQAHQDDPKTIIPVEYEGVKAISYGFISKNRTVMRGPMVSQLVSQMAHQAAWGDLDYLVIDMPPGTGDIQLTICQDLPLDAAVIVTTPQRLSFVDVVKGIEMFDVLKVPTVSIVENMALFACENCGHEHQIFGVGYLNMIQKQFGILNSFQLPLQTKLSQCADGGLPAVLVFPETHTVPQLYNKLATSVETEIDACQNTAQPIVNYQEGSQFIEVTDYDGNLIKKVKASTLRKACECALCVDEFTGKKILNDDSIPDDVHPTVIEKKGNYAVAVVWSDGHKSSIYPYSLILNDLKVEPYVE